MAIELIPTEIKEEKRKEKVGKTLKIVSVAVFLVGLVLGVASLGITSAVSLTLGNTKKDVESTLKEIGKFSDLEPQVRLLEVSFSLVQEVLTQRNYYTLLLDGVEESIPLGIYVKGVSASPAAVEGGSEEARINGSTQTYVDLARFMLNLTDPEKGGSVFSEVFLSAVTLDPTTGTANFDLVVQIKKDGLKKLF